tara:strand:+ start:10927 stop:11319 length:393 start_codon:yes stop_codon:yes gene_type:complete
MLNILLPLIGTVIDRVIPDKAGAEKAKQEIERSLIENSNKLNLAQIEVNKVEASNSNIFVSGWRPAIGWSCAFGFFWLFIGYPLADWILHLNGVEQELPKIDADVLMELTFGMLGMAGLRTFEKLKGITK